MPSTTAGQPAARGWASVGAIAAGTFVMVTSEFLPIGLLGTLARDLDVTEGRAGLMVTVPGFVAAIAAPLLTMAAGRFDRRHLLLGLTALILIADLVVAAAPDLKAALIGRAVLGAALGGFWAFAAAAGRRLVADRDGNRATALILGGISVGTVLGVPLGTVLTDLLGWRAAFLLVGGGAAAVLVAQSIFLPALPGTVRASVGPLLAVLRNPAVRTAYVAAALVASGHFAAYTYLQPFASIRAGIDGTALTSLLAAYGLAGVGGTWAGERLAARNVARTFAGVAIVIAGAIGASVLAGARPWLVAPLIVLWGAAFGAFPVCLQAWLHHAAPSEFESSSALVVTVFQLAVAAGAFTGGIAVDFVGPAAAFAVGGSVALLAVPVLLAARGNDRERAAPFSGIQGHQ